jgi:hypothetical protein
VLFLFRKRKRKMVTTTIPVSFLLINLVYCGKILPMDQGKYNMIRGIWRSLEVLLFFVISVVGFNLFAKTTSFNTKTKARSLSGSPVAPRELSLPGITMHGELKHLCSLLIPPQQQHSPSITAHCEDNHYSSTLHHHHLSLSYSHTDQKQNHQPLPSPLSKPGNLFQQNSVLLI